MEHLKAANCDRAKDVVTELPPQFCKGCATSQVSVPDGGDGGGGGGTVGVGLIHFSTLLSCWASLVVVPLGDSLLEVEGKMIGEKDYKLVCSIF